MRLVRELDGDLKDGRGVRIVMVMVMVMVVMMVLVLVLVQSIR